jgi:hypothetical protein
MLRSVIIALCLGCSAVAGIAQSGLGWVPYQNDRFGFELRMPAAVFTDHRAAEAGDGDLFATSDGRAKLLVGAIENVDDHSPATYQRFLAISPTLDCASTTRLSVEPGLFCQALEAGE